MSMDVDWASIDDICRTHSIVLEQNDASLRAAYDVLGPVVHTDYCWLGKNYADQPNVWHHGCDCGALKSAGRIT